MKRYTRYFLTLLCLIGVLAQPGRPLTQAALASADAPLPQGPGWHNVTLTAGPSPATAREAAAARKTAAARAATSMAQAQQAAGLPATAAEVTPEIQALARALHHDPKLIFDYVHNHIDYVPIFGTLNGATGTLLAGRGTDADQAALFIALMKASGYTANYVISDVTYPVDTLANWVGTEAAQAGNVFVNGGIPIASGMGGYQITRIWAEVEIGGTTYTFDPAMKEYRETTGIADLGSALGYNRMQFLNHAQVGATTTTSYTLNLNEANIRADLSTYTMNLVDYIDAHLPTGGVADVTGGREIVHTEMAAYATTLPNAISTANISRPANLAGYRHTLRIEHAGIDHTFDTFQIADKRVTIFYDETDSNKPVLRVDGTPVLTGTATVSGTIYTMSVTVTHPYNGFDQTAQFHLKSDGDYALLHDFNTVSADVIAAGNARLAQYRHDGLSEDSEAMLGEALSIMGWTWLHQVHLFTALVGRVGDVVPLSHHKVGIMGQTDGYFIDVPMGMISDVSTDGNSDTWAAFRAQTMMGSAFEHGALVQLQDMPSVSTIKLLQISNSSGITKTFLADSGNWAAVKPQLQNYSAGQLAQIEYNVVTNTHTVVLPEDAHITLNQWRGVGYIDDYQSGDQGSMGMIISGGYSGGYGTITDTVNVGDVLTMTTPLPPDRKENIKTPEDSDPVDMTTGAFHNGHVDLALGGSEPFGLHFVRAYNSGSHYNLGRLGYGWAYTYDIFLRTHSDGPVGLGTRGAKDAAALIAYTHVALDLLADERPIEEWMTTALATKWAMDQLIDNAVTVHTGQMTLEFTRLPDGTYTPPPGIHCDLIKSSAEFYLQGAYNGCYTFDATSGTAESWQDTDGNALSFEYNAGALEQVASSAGITLTLSYNGDGLLTNVSDHTGRVVTYTYASDELIAYTDAMSHTWTYDYDDAHRLTSITRPEGNTVATNAYDDQGRVITQTDAISNMSTFYFSGYRNALESPGGNQTVYYLDDEGQMIGRRDALGNRFDLDHNGRGRLTALTDRIGDTTTLTYHAASGKIASVTNNEGDVISYTYAAQTQTFTNSVNAETVDFTFYNLTRVDYPDGTHDSFGYDARGNVTTHTDQAGVDWAYQYNTRGQVTQITNPAGGAANYAYNTDGTLASVTDSDTGVTTYGYDDYKRPITITHPGGAVAQIAYNLNDQVTSITDERGKTYTYAHDGSGNLVATTDPLGKANNYSYDLMDRVNGYTDRRGKATNYTYDVMGRPASVTDPNGNTTQWGYDLRGWLNQITDPAGKVWQFGYDAEGLITSITTPLHRTTTLGRDRLGNLTSVTDPLNHTVILTRNEMNRITAVTDPLTRTTSYTYNARGLLTGVTLPDGGAAIYTRNNVGLLTRITDPGGHNWDFGYTSMGRLQSLTDTLGSLWGYTYDTRGFLAQVAYPDGYTQTLAFDADGNLIRRQYSAGPDLNFSHDDLGRLTATDGVTLTYNQVGQVTNTQSASFSFGASYDDGGRVQTVTYADGSFTVTYAWNSRDLLTRVSDSLTGASVQFAYDDDGRLTGITRSNGVNATLTWDAASRLTRLQEGALADMQYTYNGAGQVTQATLDLPLDPAGYLVEQTDSLTYDAASQISTAGYTYDERGRLTASPGQTYAWDGASRLTGVDTATLAYNGLGNPTDRTEGGAATHYDYNYALGLHPIVAERDGASSQWQRFYVLAPDGRLLYAIDAANGNKVFFYHYDRMGNTLLLTDAAGNQTDAYAYPPYGKLLHHEGTSTQPFTFGGAYQARREGDSDLYQLRARYYDANSARFLSREPLWPRIGTPQALNPYQYARQNPMLYVDRTGMEEEVETPWKPGNPAEDAGLFVDDYGLSPKEYAEWLMAQAPSTLGEYEMDEISRKFGQYAAEWAKRNIGDPAKFEMTPKQYGEWLAVQTLGILDNDETDRISRQIGQYTAEWAKRNIGDPEKFEMTPKQYGEWLMVQAPSILDEYEVNELTHKIEQYAAEWAGMREATKKIAP